MITPHGPITAAQIEDIAVLKTENFRYIEVMVFDPDTEVAIGTDKAFVHIPFAGTLLQVHARVSTTSSSGDPVFNIKKNGGEILSTKISIDAGEYVPSVHRIVLREGVFDRDWVGSICAESDDLLMICFCPELGKDDTEVVQS